MKSETKAVETAVLGYQMLARTKIRPSKSNPRKTFDAGRLGELAKNIGEMGIVQPLVVRLVLPKFTLHEPDLTCKSWVVLDEKLVEVHRATSKESGIAWANKTAGEDAFQSYYELVAGERRWRAAEIAKLDLVPAMVRQLTDQEMAEVQLVENYQRDDLLPVEEAEAFADLVERNVHTPESLAAVLKASRSHVYSRLKLAKLPKAVKEQVAAGKLNAALAELVARVPGEKLQLQAIKEICEGGDWVQDSGKSPEKEPMSVRKAKVHLRDNYTLDLEKVPWDLKDADLVPEAGSCKECPKRSGNCTLLFPELKNPNVCTDPTCHNAKGKAHATAVRAEAEAQARKEGLEILPEKESKDMFRHGDQPMSTKYVPEVMLSEERVTTKGNKTVKQVLGKELPAPKAVIGPDGTMFKVWDREEVLQGLEAKGVKRAKTVDAYPTYNPEERRKEEMKRLLRERTNQAVALAFYAAAEKPIKSEKAEHAWWCRFVELMARVFSEVGWTWEPAFERREVSTEACDWGKVPVETLRGIAMELLVADSPEMLRMFADNWGIDEKKVAATVKEELEAEMRLPKHLEEVKVPRELLDRMEASHSADKIDHGKIAEPVEWKGRLWTSTGGLSSGEKGNIQVDVQLVVPLAEYKDKAGICTYAQRIGKINDLEAMGKKKEADKIRENGFYTGVEVEWKGEDYVLSEPEVKLIPDSPLPKKEKKKG